MSTLDENRGGVEPNPALGRVDWREQPYNAREVGPVEHIQNPAVMITLLHAIVLDLDLDLLRAGAPVVDADVGPKRFLKKTAGAWLSRHPALARAEVRSTGSGLHVLIWFDEAVEIHTDGERRRWEGVVKVVQAALPVDPDQPGLTALTRPVGSINSKKNRRVSTLRPGSPVPVAAVLDLYAAMSRAPFRTVLGILFGSDRVSPCPACRAEGSSLAALDHVGRCYGSCGTVRLGQLYDVFLAPRPPKGGEAAVGEA